MTELKVVDDVAAEAASLTGGSVAWFQENGRPPAFPEAFTARAKLEPVASVRDGLLLRLAPR